jgi:hypothetical protein
MESPSLNDWVVFMESTAVDGIIISNKEEQKRSTLK